MNGRATQRIICGLSALLVACAQDGLKTLRAQPVIQCPVVGQAAAACAQLSFGNVPVGSTATLPLLLADTGQSALNVTGSSWTTGSDPDFSAAFTITRVSGGGSSPFSITFRPHQFGPATGAFSITSVDSTLPTVQIQVSGTGTGQSQPALDVTSVDFGNVLENTTATKVVHLFNGGNVSLSVASVSISTGTVFSADLPLHTAVGPSASVAFNVTYSPVAAEQDAATLTIGTTDEGSNATHSAQAALTGESEPVIQVTPPALDFTGVLPAAMPTMTVTVANAGKADLQVTGLVLAAGTSPFFTITPSVAAPSVVHPGASQTVLVTYDTAGNTAATADTGTLVITSNDPATPSVDVPINGTCPTCNMPDSGCNAMYPHRLWPVSADVSPCPTGQNTVGASAENWFDYDGCGDVRDFAPTPSVPIQISSWGDGCACAGCILWHIDYSLQENPGSGFVVTDTVQAQDAVQCPATGGTTNTTIYTPMTDDVKMTAMEDTTGIGFYFSVCSQ